MTPEELRAAFMKSRGMTLDSNPIPIPPPTPVQTVPITPTAAAPAPVAPAPVLPPPPPPPSDIVRTDANGRIVGNITSNPVDNPGQWGTNVPKSAVAAAAAAPPPAPFPDRAPPIPNVPAGQGPGGITLNSTPIAQGWEGTVGQEGPAAEAAKPDTKTTDALAGVAGMVEALGKKKPADSQMNALTPMSSQPNTNNPMAAQLLASLLQKNRGLTLTGH